MTFIPAKYHEIVHAWACLTFDVISNKRRYREKPGNKVAAELVKLHPKISTYPPKLIKSSSF